MSALVRRGRELQRLAKQVSREEIGRGRAGPLALWLRREFRSAGGGLWTSAKPAQGEASQDTTETEAPAASSSPASAEGTTTATAADGGGKEGGNSGATAGKSVQVSPEQAEDDSPGAVGGFMRGLFGGGEVAAEDVYRREAKEAGIDVEEELAAASRRRELQVVRRQRSAEDDDDDDAEGGRKHTIRDRLFSRFAGSAFMRGAMDAKERISEQIDESENPVVNFFRDLYARMFSETEMGQVIREIREHDPAFRIYDFLRDMEHNYIPTILKAYLSGDLAALKEHCTEDAFEVLTASIREQAKEGIKMDPSILDISDVELAAAKFLQDTPVLIVSFAAQQINCLRDRNDKVIEGKEDDIRAVYYVWALTREHPEPEAETPTGGTAHDAAADENPEGKPKDESKASSDDDDAAGSSSTDGPLPWKLMEMVIRAAHSTI